MTARVGIFRVMYVYDRWTRIKVAQQDRCNYWADVYYRGVHGAGWFLIRF
jgi:hypothetical protein